MWNNIKMWTILKHKYDIKWFLNETTFKYKSQLNTKYLKYETKLITKWHNTKPHLTWHDIKRHFWHETFLIRKINTNNNLTQNDLKTQ